MLSDRGYMIAQEDLSMTFDQFCQEFFAIDSYEYVVFLVSLSLVSSLLPGGGACICWDLTRGMGRQTASHA